MNIATYIKKILQTNKPLIENNIFLTPSQLLTTSLDL